MVTFDYNIESADGPVTLALVLKTVLFSKTVFYNLFNALLQYVDSLFSPQFFHRNILKCYLNKSSARSLVSLT